jgi:hypothetical protein
MTHDFVMRHGKKIYIETLDTGIRPKPKRQRREFIMITRVQSKLLDATHNRASEKIFRHLLFLAFKTHGAPIQLSNTSLLSMGISRLVKYRVLRELETLGLIQVHWRPRKSPKITIKDGNGGH